MLSYKVRQSEMSSPDLNITTSSPLGRVFYEILDHCSFVHCFYCPSQQCGSRIHKEALLDDCDGREVDEEAFVMRFEMPEPAPEKDGNKGNHNGNGNANSSYRDTTPFKSDLLFFVEQNIGPVKRFGGKLTTALGKELQKEK